LIKPFRRPSTRGILVVPKRSGDVSGRNDAFAQDDRRRAGGKNDCRWDPPSDPATIDDQDWRRRAKRGGRPGLEGWGLA